MKRRQVLQFGLASLPLIAFPAITRAQKKLDVKMCLDWAFLSYQAVFTIPVDDGTYQSLGLNVQVDRGNGTVDSISKVAGHAYDFGHADMYAVADFNNRNPDNPIMGVMLTHDKALVAVTAMNTSGIRKPAVVKAQRRAPQASHTLDQPVAVGVDDMDAFAAVDHHGADFFMQAHVRLGMQMRGNIPTGQGIVSEGHCIPPHFSFVYEKLCLVIQDNMCIFKVRVCLDERRFDKRRRLGRKEIVDAALRLATVGLRRTFPWRQSLCGCS